MAEFRLGFVHRQLQSMHHGTHDAHGLLGRATAADHEIIGIIDDVSAKTLLVTQRLPAQDEPTHVEVGEQGRDRCPLRAAPVLVLVSGRSLVMSAFVDLFHRRFQPPLDQLEYVPIAAASGDRFQEFAVRDRVEVTR